MINPEVFAATRKLFDSLGVESMTPEERATFFYQFLLDARIAIRSYPDSKAFGKAYQDLWTNRILRINNQNIEDNP
ncbi:MAG TPA: hypothetical protein VFV92_14525 [Candidatus Bathyarchaeia archaeon]|nr:hypothetical protein [Candidatus Bathyarchaeia archaeon]